MEGKTIEELKKEYRNRRVKRIKKIIVTLVILLILTPTILSVFLIFRVSDLEYKMNNLIKKSEDYKLTNKEKNNDTYHANENATSDLKKTDSTGNTDINKIFLTFDDGPSTETNKILDILKKKSIKATFFVTGKEDEFSKKIYKRIVDEGHTIGLHSYSHIYKNIYKDKESFASDLKRIKDLIYNTCNTNSVFFRFPGGSASHYINNNLKEYVNVLNENNLQYIDWNILSPDISDRKISKEKMIKKIIDDTGLYNTSVILMYDSPKYPLVKKVLPKLIDQLKKDNKLLPIDEDTPKIRHKEI